MLRRSVSRKPPLSCAGPLSEKGRLQFPSTGAVPRLPSLQGHQCFTIETTPLKEREGREQGREEGRKQTHIYSKGIERKKEERKEEGKKKEKKKKRTHIYSKGIICPGEATHLFLTPDIRE